MWRAPFVAIALFLLLGLAGCARGGRAIVTQQPRWNYQEYHRIAVLPIRAPDPRAGEAARQAEFLLTDQLAGNGAFEVLTKRDLADVLTEQDFSRLADVVDPGTTLPEGKIKAAQALVVGKITDFDLIKERRERRIPQYARDPKGRLIVDRYGRPRVVGERVVEEFRHAAVVGGNVRVIDAATGKVLLSHSTKPIEVEDSQRGSPPRAQPEEMAEQAAKELATDFYKQIAPIQTAVKLKGDMLVAALDYYEGRYETTKKLPTTLDQFLLVVRDLPEECDRNAFRVAIAPEEGRENLFESDEFIWSASRGQRGVAFTVQMSALASAGGNRFVAKLYNADDDAPILTTSFRLEPPKEEKSKDKKPKREKSKPQRPNRAKPQEPEEDKDD